MSSRTATLCSAKKGSFFSRRLLGKVLRLDHTAFYSFIWNPILPLPLQLTCQAPAIFFGLWKLLLCPSVNHKWFPSFPPSSKVPKDAHPLSAKLGCAIFAPGLLETSPASLQQRVQFLLENGMDVVCHTRAALHIWY